VQVSALYQAMLQLQLFNTHTVAKISVKHKMTATGGKGIFFHTTVEKMTYFVLAI